MRLPLILLMLSSGVALGAEEEVVPGNGVRQPLSGDPGWRAQVSAGGGIVMVNSAGGQHYLTPEVTAQAAWRASPLLTYRSRLDFTHRKDGASHIYTENTHTWL